MSVLNIEVGGDLALPDGKRQPMPVGAALQLRGPTLRVAIGLHVARVEQLTKEGKKPPGPIIGDALIDTGASETCVDLDLCARSLGLEAIDFGITHGVSGPDRRPRFSVAMRVLEGDHPLIFLPKAMGVELRAQKLVALLGRDFLRNKIMIYDGIKGHFTLTW